MEKQRIVIADTDNNYIFPLQLMFVQEDIDDLEIEIITDPGYYNTLFSTPQKIDVLIVAEELYDTTLHRHNIDHIFVMTESNEEDLTGDLRVIRIFKYTSIKDIFNEIRGNAPEVFKKKKFKKEPQIILVYSACGGVGKTTIAMGIAADLARNQQVLYINAGRLQSFQRLLENQSPITTSDVYAKLANPTDNAYSDVKHVLRSEGFGYLPPFKASLMSIGLKYSVYEKIALGAKKSKDYDYIIVDADTSFDEEDARLIDMADKVILVFRQNQASAYATNVLLSNISSAGGSKYMYICNDFNREQDNALVVTGTVNKFQPSDYVDHMEHYDRMKPADFAKESGIHRIALSID